MTVYEPESVSPFTVTPSGQRTRVRFVARELGAVSAGGAFTPANQLLEVSYELRKVEGQWRLGYVPPGVLLTPRDLSRSYRPIQTYAYDAARQVLVPQPGYVLSDRAGLAGAALHALLTNWGSPTGTTPGLPAGLTALGSVVVRDGDATVDLGREAFTVPPSRRGLLVSQIAASLASVPGVFTVQVLVEERPYVGGSVPARVPPELQAASVGPALASTGGVQVVALTDRKIAPLRWNPPAGSPFGLDSAFVATPVAAPGGGRLAALRTSASQTQLTVAALSGDSTPAATLLRNITLAAAPGSAWMAPAWLDRQRIVMAQTAGPALLVNTSNGSVSAVTVGRLSALGPLAAFVLSRDGSRAMAVAGAPGTRRLYLGRVTATSGNGLRIDNWTAVPTSFGDVAGVGWSAELAVTVLGSSGRSDGTGGALRAEVVSLSTVSDPIALAALPPEVSAAGDRASLAAAAGRPTLISDGIRSWRLVSGVWQPVGTASAPSYP